MNELATRRYRRFRRRYLLQHNLCRDCREKFDRRRGAQELDHIVPRALGGRLYDRDNLQPLCCDCHAEKSDRDRRAIAARRGQGRSLPCAHGIPLRACSVCQRQGERAD